MPASLIVLLAGALAGQAAQPLKKSDLIRLLSAATLAPAEIAELVHRNCLTFTPSARDMADLRALGADEALLRRVNECTRRSSALRATVRLSEALVTAGGAPAVVTARVWRGDAPARRLRLVLRGSSLVTGSRDAEATTDERGTAVFELRPAGSPGTHRLTVAAVSGQAVENVGTVELTLRPARRVAVAARTGFVSGLGQRGRVGTRLGLPLVFEARDSLNAPVAGQPVQLAAVNARLDGSLPATDSAGRVRAFVTLGTRAGPARVTATLGGITREVMLTAFAGPPARLVLRCGSTDVRGRLELSAGAVARVDVTVQDVFGNPLPVADLRVSVGDDDVVQAGAVGGDSTARVFTLRARRAGATNLVVLGAGLRERVTAAVVDRGGAPPCRGGGARG
jgi:hypothetical protein